MKLKNTVKSTLISTVLALLLFFLARPAFAQLVAGDIILDNSLLDGQVTVGSVVGKNGYRQIYYETNGKKTSITDEAYPNADPVISGEYVSWMAQIDGYWQILLYHIPTATKMKLSNSSNNANPDIEDGKVVWESQVNGVWQVYLYDGTKIIQLTSGDMSINPDIEGSYVTYGRRDVNGTYRSVVYSIKNNDAKEVSLGESSKQPKLKKGKIVMADNEEFPLSADDIFLLNFEDVPQVPSPVSSQDILTELESLLNSQTTVEETPSATPSASP